MTAADFFEKYDRNYPKFEWFIKKYFPKYVAELKLARDADKFVRVLDILNDVWYKLPDNKFNIIVMPEGWREFLYTIEE
jgi:hypothetical protein